jgi:magnesium-transporting ATPase (P-type)
MVSVIREAYEDIKRYRSDTRSNQQLVNKIMRDGTIVKLKSSDIHVGDTLLIKEGEEFPTDLILLDSSAKGDYLKSHQSIEDSLAIIQEIEEGTSRNRKNSILHHLNECQAHCFIETSSLDGEKNLKKRLTPKHLHVGGGTKFAYV